ncbi:MAG: hypothetical protein HKN36_04795 [Hellea sp.]|nr:hypothetical protein [Hellea sp.]
MKAFRHLVLAASAAILAACASTTPYQPASKPGGFDGYSQTMLDNDTARITFGGNSLTDRETVENYLIYRAAEMALERGYQSFALTNRETEKNSKLRSTGPALGYGPYDPFFHYSFYRPRYGWSRFNRYSYFRNPYRRGFGFGLSAFHDPFYNDFHVREITKYRATAEVDFGYAGSSDAMKTFNAREVIDNLSPTIVFPEEKS